MGTLFEIYGEEVTPTKEKRNRRHDRAATAMFLKLLGPNRRPDTLSRRDWNRFIREHRAGRIGPSGKPVGNRTLEWNLTFLRDLTAPVVGAGARLYRHRARRLCGEEAQQLPAAQFPAVRHRPVRPGPVHLKSALCRIGSI